MLYPSITTQRNVQREALGKIMQLMQPFFTIPVKTFEDPSGAYIGGHDRTKHEAAFFSYFMSGHEQ